MNADRILLAARLMGYLGDHERAADILDEGLGEYPNDPRLRYQRGIIRLITRAIPAALVDFEHAVRAGTGTPELYREQVVADVLDLVLERDRDSHSDSESRAAGGSVQVGARLHLGLARYLLGDYATAVEDFEATRLLAQEPHQYLAALDWQHLALHRSGRADQARVLVEELNWSDHRLGGAASTTARSLERCYVQRLRLYRGEARPEELLRATSVEAVHVATLGYGVGAWYQYRGYSTAAARTFARILEVGDPTTVGYLAAETEHARSTGPER